MPPQDDIEMTTGAACTEALEQSPPEKSIGIDNDTSQPLPSTRRRRQGKRSHNDTSHDDDDDDDESRDSKKQHLQDGNTENSESRAHKKKKAKSTEAEDMNWVCAECKEAECLMEPSADKFLLCDGDCHRVFHYPCAGLSQIPTEDDWICKDCSKSCHPCAFCQEYGKDNVDVFGCRKDHCGLFFHESCLALNNVPVKMVERPVSRNVSPRSVEEGAISTTTCMAPSFVCPAHHCWTCTQEDALNKEAAEEAKKKEATGKKKKRGKKKQTSIYQCKTESRLYRCLYCPWAYHLTCLPPTSKFHELAILCPEHSMTQKLPDLDLSSSLQSTVEDKIDRTIQKLSGQTSVRRRLLSGLAGGRGGALSNPFFPGLRGDRMIAQEQPFKDFLAKIDEENEISNEADLTSVALVGVAAANGVPFCLPADVKTEVHSKPPTYTHIHGLKYDPNNRPKKIPPAGEQCQCVGTCGDDCFNRVTLVECCGEGQSSNCALGADKCGNRALGKRQFVKCKPKRESGKGWGLVTLEDVPKGKLVQEYVGEVINEAEKEKRLIEWSKEHPNDPNFYVMGLGSGWYVDAREFANMSRFINHSCDPNCQVTTINVRGYKRNGIYALRDIKAGEFLCYDYHFDTKQADRFLCRCGAKNCRGTMQGGSGTDPKKALSWKEAKARYDNDAKLLAELKEKQVSSQVASLVPAAEQPTEFVAAGPPEKHRDAAVRNGIFLWRNAARGSDFVARNSRIERLETTTLSKADEEMKRRAASAM